MFGNQVSLRLHCCKRDEVYFRGEIAQIALPLDPPQSKHAIAKLPEVL